MLSTRSHIRSGEMVEGLGNGNCYQNSIRGDLRFTGVRAKLHPPSLRFSPIATEVASAVVVLENTGTLAFFFKWKPEEKIHHVASATVEINDCGITCQGARTNGFESLWARCRAFEQANEELGIQASPYLIEQFLKIRDCLRKVKGKCERPVVSARGSLQEETEEAASSRKEDELRVPSLLDEVLLLDSAVPEKRHLAFQLQSLVQTASHAAERHSHPVISLMKTILESAVDACCDCVKEARQRTGQSLILPQFLPEGLRSIAFEQDTLCKELDTDQGDPRPSSSMAKAANHPVQTQDARSTVHGAPKDGPASKVNRGEASGGSASQPLAAEMLTKQVSRLLDCWELTAALKRAEALLLEDSSEVTAPKETTSFRASGCRAKRRSENRTVAVCSVLNDACGKLDTACLTPEVEQTPVCSLACSARCKGAPGETPLLHAGRHSQRLRTKAQETYLDEDVFTACPFGSSGGAVLLLTGGDKLRDTLSSLDDQEETDGAAAPPQDVFAVLRELLSRSAREVFVSLDSSASNAKSVEAAAFSLIEGLCGENEVESRSLLTQEQILEFLEEKLPLDWDPITGSVPGDTAGDSTVYFVGRWDAFVRSVLTCLNHRENDWALEAAAVQNTLFTLEAVHEYQKQRNTEIIFRILGVKTVVLDYLPGCNEFTEVTAPWWTLVPCQRALGSSARTFLSTLCGFFDVNMSSVRDGMIRRWRDRERRAKMLDTYCSIVDYTLERLKVEQDCKVHRPPPEMTNRIVTVLTRYCEKFWDMQSARTLDCITDALSVLDTIVSLSRSTVVHIAGDLCTVLLAFLCDGKVEVLSRDKSNAATEEDTALDNDHALRTVTTSMVQAEYVLSPLGRRDAHHAPGESQETVESASPVVSGKTDNEKAAAPAGAPKLKKQPRDPHRISPETGPAEEDKGDSHSGPHRSRTRPVYLLRKFAGYQRYSQIVSKAFRRILRTATHRQITLRLPTDIILKTEPKKMEEYAADTRPRKSTKERTLDDVRETSKNRPPSRKAGRQPRSPVDSKGHRQTSTRSPELEDDDDFNADNDQYLWCRLPSSEEVFRWLDELWGSPIDGETEEDQDDNDSLKDKDVALYWAPGPLFLEELKTSLREADGAYLVGECLERVACQPDSSTSDLLMFVRSLFEPQ
ncbi:hypothetical protein CSUI_000459 [Cystoisospora suis]|uniref:Uncharacterized protein n=1 Tax=Cystoisospora suis TaxID=483139 RepID=A0A2C6LG72_9APIC|nr:hypothetical protein CSUI_000459 [Cystoisospora suis]